MKIKPILHYLALFFTLGGAIVLSGCASSSNPDPYEKFNRKIYKFNDVVDKAIYRPVAKGYEAITPNFMRRGIHNVLANVYQVPVTINDVLQLNIPLAMQDLGRLAINTTLGVGGWFDVAKHMGAPRHDQDFGITLARWGWKDSNYLLLPFFPVGTPRDLLGLYVDYNFFLPWAYVKPNWVSYSAYALMFIDKRAAFLPADQFIAEAFDPYIFIRDAYMQNRRKQIAAMMQPYGRDETLPNLDQNAAEIAKDAGESPSKPSHAQVVSLNNSKNDVSDKKAPKIRGSSNQSTDSNKTSPGASESENNEQKPSIRPFSPKNIADKQSSTKITPS